MGNVSSLTLNKMRVNLWAFKNVRLRLALEKAISAKEMWLKAQEDEGIYITTDGDASYSVVDGFIMENLNVSNIQTLSDWMNKIWKKQECRKMTKAEAEKEFGIKIID